MGSGGGRRQLWLRRLRQVPWIAVAVGVVVVVVAAVGHHRAGHGVRARPGVAPGAHVPAPASLLPAHGGTRGLLLGTTVDGSGRALLVTYVDCTNCGEGTPARPREVTWSATSSDGGRHWRVARTRFSLYIPQVAPPAGSDVWESGYPPRAVVPSFLVSHDRGLSFRVASAPAYSGSEAVTADGGEAWTLGVRCVRYLCRSSVLHGPVTGARLTRTAAQPPGMPSRSAPTVLEVAGNGRRAYVSEGAHHRLFTTTDAGRTWMRARYPCSGDTVIGDLGPSAGGGLWVTCTAGQRQGMATPPPVTVRRSPDGGRHWMTPDPALHAALHLTAVSPRVAWARETDGSLLRTSDGGRSWTVALRGVGGGAALDVEGPVSATVVAPATTGTAAAGTRRTDLVVYRTGDGGARWTHSVIPLP